MADTTTQSTALAIEVCDLARTYGKHKALDGVDFVLEPGEMVALIGPSGAGKSTLLRHISGLQGSDRDRGVVRVHGQLVQEGGRISRKIRRIRSRIGFVFQQFNLVSRLTLLTNVTIGMLAKIPLHRSLLRWFTRAEKRRAMVALDRVGIAPQAAQRACTLSGGQQQRAAIARALVQGAEIILADEPIASLDPASSQGVMKALQDINEQDGVTVLVSLHQVNFAMQYCPRSIALKDGRVIYDGPSERLTEDLLHYIYGEKLSESGLVEEAGARSPHRPARPVEPTIAPNEPAAAAALAKAEI